MDMVSSLQTRMSWNLTVNLLKVARAGGGKPEWSRILCDDCLLYTLGDSQEA
jgi:hypothetical protein